MLLKFSRPQILAGLMLFIFLVVNSFNSLFAQTSQPSEKPVAYFAHIPFKIIVGEIVVFDASISKGEISQYEWDYDNDGRVDQITSFPFGTWVFKKAGLVMVRLKVIDKKFKTAQAIYGLMVYEVSQRPGPLVNFSAKQEPKTYNIVFTPQIQDIGIQPSYYIWDFGDGIQSYIRIDQRIDKQLNHRYKKDGIYRVFVRACTNDHKCHETARVINVKYQLEQGGLGGIIIIILFMVAYSCVASLCF